MLIQVINTDGRIMFDFAVSGQYGGPGAAPVQAEAVPGGGRHRQTEGPQGEEDPSFYTVEQYNILS